MRSAGVWHGLEDVTGRGTGVRICHVMRSTARKTLASHLTRTGSSSMLSFPTHVRAASSLARSYFPPASPDNPPALVRDGLGRIPTQTPAHYLPCAANAPTLRRLQGSDRNVGKRSGRFCMSTNPPDIVLAPITCPTKRVHLKRGDEGLRTAG